MQHLNIGKERKKVAISIVKGNRTGKGYFQLKKAEPLALKAVMALVAC